MTIAVGESLPNVTLMLVTPDGPKPVATKDYFAGKTVVLFGLPGAFTPTCHKIICRALLQTSRRSRPRASTPSP